MRIFITACLLLAMLAAFAQPDPGQPQPMGGAGQPIGIGARNFNPQAPPMFQALLGAPQIIMEVTENGFFVLQNGTLLKYDPATLKAQGTVELFGPLPNPQARQAPAAVPAQADKPAALNAQQPPFAQPAQQAQDAPGANEQLRQQTLRRSAPAVMLIKDPSLLIVVGNTFFRVNQNTLAIEAKGTLGDNNNPNAAVNRRPITAKQHADLLYIEQGGTLSVIDSTNGQLKGQAVLPEAANVQVAAQWGGVFQNVIGIQPVNPAPQQLRPFAQAGGGDDAAVDPGNVMVGTIGKHDTLWTITTDDRQVYLLVGPKSQEMAALPNITGKRVRVIGKQDHTPGDNAFAQGHMDVLSYQLITN